MNKQDLLLDSYHYDLADRYIADRPCESRDDSRLLYYQNSSRVAQDRCFKDIVDLIPENALMVLNASKVFPCRVFANKTSGAKAEIFFLDLNGVEGSFSCLIKSGGKKHVGDSYLCAEVRLTISKVVGDGTFLVSSSSFTNSQELESFLNREGQTPIPPYIRSGLSDEGDRDRYQTVFAKHTGSVAAPTAGLHFSEELLEKIQLKGAQLAEVSLHVGLGTFAPVKNQDLTQHEMHRENYFIDEKNLELISMAYKKNRPIIAVGTTSLRVLESSYQKITENSFEAQKVYSTDIFLHPGKNIQSISALVTNFHLPSSTLLMLVSALVGREKILSLYEHAKDKNYRFFSYGDAMYLDLR